MTRVGIIANPAASKDIRRLVAQGRVIPDWEKVNIVRRALLGLQAVGVGEVLAMPDSSHLCQRARDDSQLSLNLSLLEMPAYYTEGDSIRAAGLMEREGVDCLITLGGDGTNRAVACGTCSVPIVPISTGTNNIFPQMVEGTLAGLAAGLVATGKLTLDWVAGWSKTLAVYVDGEFRDLALVDVALLSMLRDGLLRRSEAAALTWGDLEFRDHGSALLQVRRSKTDPGAQGVVLYVGQEAEGAL